MLKEVEVMNQELASILGTDTSPDKRPSAAELTERLKQVDWKGDATNK